jgi:Ca-activated chloride channel family protein
MNIVTWGITLGCPQNLIFSPLLVIVLGVLLYRFKRSKRAAAQLAVAEHTRHLLPNFSHLKQIFKIMLLMIGLIALFLALLQPQWHKREYTVTQKGRDLFIALDISRSMLAQDVVPSRLALAKAKIKELIKKLSCERVGLILFSGSSFVQCPLTSDYSAFFMFLDQIDVETISSGTTALDQAIRQGLAEFKTMPERKNKLLILLTDGEDFSSDLSGVKNETQKIGMHIVTLGLGTQEGAPIPLYDDRGKPIGHQLDKKGAVVISRLNEGILHSLAQDSGGVYIRVTPDDHDLKTLLAYVQSYEKEDLGDKKISEFEEQYPYFVAISFVCFAGEWLL